MESKSLCISNTNGRNTKRLKIITKNKSASQFSDCPDLPGSLFAVKEGFGFLFPQNGRQFDAERAFERFLQGMDFDK